MTLWINGDWITGQGASRVKRNPVSGEVLWQGNDADAAQVGKSESQKKKQKQTCFQKVDFPLTVMVNLQTVKAENLKNVRYS